MKRFIQVLSVVALIPLGSASALAQTTALTQAIQEEERAALSPSARMIELGQTIAGTECAKCHGMDGISSGESRPHLAGQRTIYLYRVLRAYQGDNRESKSMQHVSSFLSGEAMLAVSAYYANLSPVSNARTPEAIEEPGPLETDPFTGIRSSIKKCTRCHGETGNSTASGMPNLTGQDPEYFAASMQAYGDGSRDHKLMKRLAGKLDEQSIMDMGVFYAVQQPERSKTQGEGNIESGRALAEECGACHGGDGNAGGKNMPTLAGQDARYFIKAMKAYQDGKRQNESMLEAVEGLTEEGFKDLATYYAVQEPLQRDVRIPLSTPEWIARCDRCHGIDGNSTDPRFPMLAGQNKNYLRAVMQAYSDGNRSEPIMHKMSEPLSETDIEYIAAHYASREPRSVVYIDLPCPETPE